MTHRQTTDLCPTPARRRGEGRDGSPQYGDGMIGPVGTVDLHVTSTSG